MTVSIADPLPLVHNGQLETPPALSRELRAPGVPGSVAVVLGGLWALLLAAVCLAAWLRFRAGRVSVPRAEAEDALPGKLRLAEVKLLTPQGLAEIERELLARWRHELHLEMFPQIELFRRLERDARGRELLAALEEWRGRLERGPAPLPPLLEPYAEIPSHN
jgi:hypothetical protein